MNVYFLKFYNRYFYPFTSQSKFKLKGQSNFPTKKLWLYRIAKLSRHHCRAIPGAMCRGSTASMGFYL